MTVVLMKYKSVYFVLAVRGNCEGVVSGTFPSAMKTLRLLLTLPCGVASGDHSVLNG